MRYEDFLNPLYYEEDYVVDIRWFENIKCRQPMYNCINFYEFFILDEYYEVIDSIKLYPQKMGDRYIKTDRQTYCKIQEYLKKAGKNHEI